MCLRSALRPLACYLLRRLTSCRDRLTTFTWRVSVLSSVAAPHRMMSKTFLGVRSRLRNAATAVSPIIPSRFTTHSKRIRVGDVSYAHADRTNPDNTRYLVTFQI